MTDTSTQHADNRPASVEQSPPSPAADRPAPPPAVLPLSPSSSQPAAEVSWLQRWRRVPELWLLAVMLLLAMVGMAVAQAFEKRGWLIWGFITIAYAGISLWFGRRHADSTGEPFWPEASKHIFHWLGLFLGLKVMFALEAMGFLDRIIVSDVALLLLALTCYFAGVHLHWIFLVVALFVGLMAYLNASFTENMWLSTAFFGVVAVGAVGLLLKSRPSPGKGAPRS